LPAWTPHPFPMRYPQDDPRLLGGAWYSAVIVELGGTTPESYRFVEWEQDPTTNEGREKENGVFNVLPGSDPGDPAYAIDGGTYAVDDIVFVRRSQSALPNWDLMAGGNTGDALGCSPFASLEATSCLQLTVRGTPAGRCEDIDPDQTILLEDDDEDGVWTGTTQFVTDTDSWDVLYEWPAGACCPQLTFDNGTAVSLRYMGCDNGKLVFIGYGTLLCAQNVDETPCADNSFAVELECVQCPNPDYAGPGWYCVAVTGCTGERSCIEYTSDPGAGVVLCLGPYTTEEECGDNCIVDTVTLCGGAVTLPTVLFVRWPDDYIYDGANSNYRFCVSGQPYYASYAGTLTTLTYNVGTGYWEGPFTGECGNPGTYFELIPTCTGSVVTGWELNSYGDMTLAGIGPTGGMAMTIASSSPLHLTGASANVVDTMGCCTSLFCGGAGTNSTFQVFE
jgi:hypothetical protein